MAKFSGRRYHKGKGKGDDDEDRDYGRGKGGYKGKKGKGKGDDNSEFIHITGLFESKSGNSHTVFLKKEIIEKLQDLEEEDLLGVSETQYGLSLWVRKADKK